LPTSRCKANSSSASAQDGHGLVGIDLAQPLAQPQRQHRGGVGVAALASVVELLGHERHDLRGRADVFEQRLEPRAGAEVAGLVEQHVLVDFERGALAVGGALQRAGVHHPQLVAISHVHQRRHRGHRERVLGGAVAASLV
jgi:hypothetical protein